MFQSWAAFYVFYIVLREEQQIVGCCFLNPPVVYWSLVMDVSTFDKH